MIKNVIFDVGGVLLEWNPSKFLMQLSLPAHFEPVFESLLWATHDGGLITRQEVVEKLPRHLNKEMFSYCVEHLAGQMRPIAQMIDLFHGVRREGYKVFILSNMPREMHQELAPMHDFFMHADGQIFSYEIQAIKPQPQIYRALLQKYKLDPEKSVFIDDRLDNIESAQKLRLKTIHCLSAEQVRSDLVQMGLIRSSD